MRRSNRYGFTLVELLVVIAIIGILVALLLPAVQAAREAARRMSCSNNLKQLGLALHNYHDTHKQFPPEAIYGNGVIDSSGFQGPYHYTWLFQLLPFIEQSPLYESAAMEYPAWIGPDGNPQAFISAQIDTLKCPSDDGPSNISVSHNLAYTNYAGSEGFDWWGGSRTINGVLPAYGGQCEQQRVANLPKDGDMINIFQQVTNGYDIGDIKDGTSNTIVISEVTFQGYKWGKSWCGVAGGEPRVGSGEAVFRVAFLAVCSGAYPIECNNQAGGGTRYAWRDPSGGTTWWFPAAPPHPNMPTYISAFGPNNEWPGPSSNHPGGIQSARADGSVGFVSQTIPWHIWMQLNAMKDGYSQSYTF
jgi:prepilin-type N-terminal cleavage/methylation domain-containing protein